MKLSLLSYGKYTITLGYIHGGGVVFERRYFLENIYPKTCFLFQVFSILFQYAGKEWGISLLASPPPKIPLIPIS